MGVAMSGIPPEVLSDVRQRIETDEIDGAEAVVSLANQYAVSRTLKYQSTIVKSEVLAADSSETRTTMRTELLVLVEKVVKDNAEPSQADLARKELFEKAQARVSELPSVERGFAFQCRDLGRVYGRTGFRLQNVNLDLRLGEITGVVGENANGKTTLFNIIAGRIRHTSGTLWFPELGAATPNQVQWAKVKRDIAYVPQILERWHGSLRENLAYAAAVHGLRGSANKDEVDYIVERLDLRAHLKKRWTELSGGFRLRFELARALVCRPRLLVLDEPLANLDFRAQLTVLQDISDLARSDRRPIAVIMSSQHLYETEAIADNIMLLRDGRIEYSGPTSEVGENRLNNTFELGSTVPTARLRERLRGLDIERMYHNGLSHVVVTGLGVTDQVLLEKLMANEVQLTYFRNTSKSVKGLFEMNRRAGL
jgi:ABC-2 type transport system ATP-binding protein